MVSGDVLINWRRTTRFVPHDDLTAGCNLE